MYCDFMAAGDEIFNQMAKWQAMSGDVLEMPLVLRAPSAPGNGASTAGLERHGRPHSGAEGVLPGDAFTTPRMLALALRQRPGRLLREPASLPRRRDAGRGRRAGGGYVVPEGEPALRKSAAT